MTWFNEINLPIYTGDLIAGALLDWVATALYGLARPALPSGKTTFQGPLNTYTFNSLALNRLLRLGPSNVYATTDDIYKRILTWHFFKGDGKYFSIRWLKRRVMRFLFGTNGINFNVDATYQIGVSFGPNGVVAITLYQGNRFVTGGSLLNRWWLNSTPLNTVKTVFETYAPLPDAAIFQAAVAAGVLELPFQFEFVANIIG